MFNIFNGQIVSQRGYVLYFPERLTPVPECSGLDWDSSRVTEALRNLTCCTQASPKRTSFLTIREVALGPINGSSPEGAALKGKLFQG